MYSVIHAGGIFITVGEGSRIFTSLDAVTWTRRNTGRTETLYDVAYGAGRYVAVGAGGAILTSTNLIDWDYRKISGTTALRGVAYGGGKFMAAGSGLVVNSTYGTNWVDSSWSTFGLFTSVDYFKDRFILTFADKIYTSTDAQSLTPVVTATTTLSSTMFGRGSLVAIGTDGAIFQSAKYLEQRPVLGAITHGPANTVNLTVSAESQRAFQVQHSDDLATWTVSGASTNRSSGIVVTNVVPPGTNQRFYRVIYSD
jgi:hypothetical protein